jgi:hypothetical protein
MKTKIVKLVLAIIIFTQIACIGNECASSVTMRGVDQTSQVLFEVEGIDGHVTETSNQCVYATGNIKLAKGNDNLEFNGDTILSDSDAVKAKDMFPQFSNVQVPAQKFYISTNISETDGYVSLDVSDLNETNGFGPGISVKLEFVN